VPGKPAAAPVDMIKGGLFPMLAPLVADLGNTKARVGWFGLNLGGSRIGLSSLTGGELSGWWTIDGE